MNYKDLQEGVFRFMKMNASEMRRDYILQQVKDDINHALDRIVNVVPFLWHHVSEYSFATVVDQTTYSLDDRVIKPLSFWTEDTSAHKLRFVDPRQLDKDTSKNSSATNSESGPYTITWYPKTSTAGASGTDITISEGSTSISKAGGTAWTSADTGKIIRFNGEDMDFTFTYVGADSGTIDRAYRARLSGTGTTLVGSGLTTKKWELSPPGQYRVQIRPAPASVKTIYYRAVRKHSRMLNDDDTPDLPEEFHHIILAGAIMMNGAYQEDNAAHSNYARMYNEGLKAITEFDRVEVDEESHIGYESPLRRDYYHFYQPGVNYRNG